MLTVVASPGVAFGQAAFDRSTADHATVVMYHRFGEDELTATNTTLAQLDAHIAYLSAGAFTVWPLMRIIQAIRNGEPLPDKTVAITIDDAFASLAAHALPRFKAAGLPVTLFVSTDQVGSSAVGYMTWDDVRQAVRDGVDIGAHTVNHVHLVDVPIEVARHEIVDANRRFQAELGFVPQLFAYPYGEASLAVRAIVMEAGYVAAFGQHSGVLHESEDPFYLPRFALNEKYGTIDRFRTLASAQPLMARDVTPSDMTLEPSDNPPAFGFTVDPAVGDLAALACYASGAGKLSLQRLGGRRIEARLPQRLEPGRHRVNCTAPAAGGRWRWFGRQFYVPVPAG